MIRSTTLPPAYPLPYSDLCVRTSSAAVLWLRLEQTGGERARRWERRAVFPRFWWCLRDQDKRSFFLRLNIPPTVLDHVRNGDGLSAVKQHAPILDVTELVQPSRQ